MNTMHKLWVTLCTWTIPKAGHDKDRGVSLIEYAALVLLVGALAFAIFQLEIVGRISDAVGLNVDRILEGPPDGQ